MRPLTFLRFYALSAILGACGLWVVACASNSIGTVGPSRSGVIREREAVGTRLSDLGAQEAQSRPRTGEPHTGERTAAKASTPGFASNRPVIRDEPCPKASSGSLYLGGCSQGVRSEPGRGASTLLERVPSGAYRTLAADASRLCGVPPDLFAALVARESSWRQYDRHGRVLRSSSGALGLAQIKKSTARDVSPTLNVHEPFENLLAGACYLRQQYDRFGTWSAALHAYREGPNRRTTSTEARLYANKIMEVMQ